MNFTPTPELIAIVTGLIVFLADKLGFKIPPLVTPTPAPVPLPVPTPSPDTPRPTPWLDILDAVTTGRPLLNAAVKMARQLLAKNPLMTEADAVPMITAAMSSEQKSD